jgi:hypothetical protein
VANKRGFRLGSGNTLLYVDVDKEGDEENDANEEIDDEEEDDSDDELQAVVGE